jgi:hypothetical protein
LPRVAPSRNPGYASVIAARVAPSRSQGYASVIAARVARSRNPGYASVIAARGAVIALALVAAFASMHAAADAGARPLDPDVAARILALDPEHLSDEDVRDVLSNAPAPRIILLQGSLAFVTMQPFGEFLVAMGYPEERIRNPRDGSMTYGSFGSSEALAGNLAWYYETEGMMPVLIGHSQGGMLVVRTLHELAGAFNDAIAVRNPLTDEALARTTITDPATGSERPVIGLKVAYAAAIATGKWPRLLLGQWSMLSKLRRIPNTVVQFTGFSIAFDPIAGDFGGTDPYEPIGTARVRNVTLPASTSHILIPKTQHLAANALTRAWINAYVARPDVPALPAAADMDTTNILHAADIWYDVKKNWCREAQRTLRAPRSEARP